MLKNEWKNQRQSGHIGRLGPFMLASMLILFLVVPQIYNFWPSSENEEEKQSVELRTLSSKNWMKNKSIDSKSRRNTKAKQLAKKKKKKELEKPKGQIVDIAMPEKEEVPEESKYVSQYNSKVEKQTKAKLRKPSEKVAKRLSKAGKTKNKPQKSQKQQKLSVNMQEEKDQQNKKNGRNILQIPRLQMPLKLNYDMKGQRSKFKNTKGQKSPKQGDADKLAVNLDKNQNGQKGKSSSRRNSIPQKFMPSLSSMDTGGAPMSDYLPDVEEGNETGLNSKSYRYATYYNRIKRKVSSRWDPVKVQRRYDPTYAIYGYKNRHTVVYIVLNTDGKVDNVSIQRSCGVDFLDQEALSSIRKASPFPNPPDGIIEKDGKIKFPFGFYFEMTRSGLRLSNKK